MKRLFKKRNIIKNLSASFALFGFIYFSNSANAQSMSTHSLGFSVEQPREFVEYEKNIQQIIDNPTNITYNHENRFDVILEIPENSSVISIKALFQGKEYNFSKVGDYKWITENLEIKESGIFDVEIIYTLSDGRIVKDKFSVNVINFHSSYEYKNVANNLATTGSDNFVLVFSVVFSVSAFSAFLIRRRRWYND